MGRPRTFSDARLLEAAARVVAREGALRFTLAQVAEESGLSAPGLVQRFGGKRQLLLALSEHGRGTPSDALARARRAHASPLDALVAGLADAMGSLRTPEAVAKSLDYLALDIAEPDFRAHALAFFHALRDEVRALLREAIERGELARCDVDDLARAVEVAFNGSVITWALHRDGALGDAMRRDLAAVLAPYRAGAPTRRAP